MLTDPARDLLFVKGSVPGSKGGWLIVRDSVKVDRPAEVPYPAAVKAAANVASEVASGASTVDPAPAADVAGEQA